MQRPRSERRSQLLLAATSTILACSLAGGAQAACSITYGTLSTSLPNLGNVVSATSGETTFRIAPSTGSITQIDGSGARTSTGASLVSMTIQTGSSNDCDNLVIDATLSAVGATNRGKPMDNFDVAGSSNLVVSNESGTGSVRTFKITMQKGKTGTLYIGMDFPIKGDNEGGATGSSNLATSSYSLALTAANGNDVTRTGTGRATVRRSLRVQKNADLTFGRIVRPSSGSSTITVNATTGLRSVSGNAAAISTPAASRAWYTVTGEGAQTLSITVPTTVTMTGPGDPLTVNLTSFRPTPQQTSGGANSDGTYEFWVGGNFPLSSTAVPGAYSGAFNVTVAYN